MNRLVVALRSIIPGPLPALRIFVISNIAFLGLDILIAHTANEFARKMEWAPVLFSTVATLFLLPGVFGSKRSFVRPVERLVGGSAVVLGVLGMCFHLESGFFEKATLHDLVYSAPFVAPLSYVGVGLLLLLVHTEDARTPSLGPWVLLLALGGYVGNFGLSILDHAQNGFFHSAEWIPVASAAYAVGFLALAVIRPPPAGSPLARLCTVIMIAQMVVGAMGAAMHIDADIRHSTMTSLRDRFVFGAPAFAPLLFADLGVLALIGLWACRQGERDRVADGRGVMTPPPVQSSS